VHRGILAPTDQALATRCKGGRSEANAVVLSPNF